ncbi:2-hydroxycarboxylate transporter family protein [bacterium LRH843]|nr:2-hydroxycarboxylate transporter family protein [bacterium LRH843]
MMNDSNRTILGMPPVVFALVFIFAYAGLYLNVLPNNMVIGFTLTMTLGGLLAWIGNRIPVFHTYGGAAILCIIVPAVLVWLGLFPPIGKEIISNFFSGYSFVDFLISGLIVGSLLSMNREVLMKAGLRFIFPLLGGIIFTFLIGGLVGKLTGFGFSEAILFVVAPIMGGGIGAGAIPMSEMYAAKTGGDPSNYISLLVPAIMVANVFCIIIAAILNGIGKRNANLFKGFSGNGQILKKNITFSEESQNEKSPDSATFTNLAIGIMIAGSLYCFGYIINGFIPSIHAYAWMIIGTAIIKIANIAPKSIEQASGEWYEFVAKTWIPTILVSVSIALIDINQIIEVITNPAYLGLTVLTVVVASVAAGFIGWLVAMHFVESSIAAGLCMADVGGSGDVAVLGASERMQLMPFAQISSRLGGALMLVIMSILVPILM